MATPVKDIHGSTTARIGRAGRAALCAALLLPAALQAQTYRSPLDNTVTVTAPDDVGDLASGNNTATDSNVLALQAQLSISKIITSAVPVAAGGAVQYQITVNNQGPSAASGVTITDTLSPLLSSVTWSCTPATPASSCAAASGSGNAVSVQVNLGVNSSVILQVNAFAPDATPATLPANTATLTLPPGTTDPDPADNSASTSPIPVQASPLLAVDDTFLSPITAGGGQTPSVLVNDRLRGDVFTPGSVIVTLLTAPSGYSVDANGVVTVPADAPTGRVALTYQICERVSPSNCASATATVVVAPVAVDDSFNVAGGSLSVTASLVRNDRVPGGSTYSLSGTAIPGLVINADGSFTYQQAGGITAPLTFTYQVCLPAPDDGVCSTGTANLLVDARPIVAVDDQDLRPTSPGAAFTSTSVLANDQFNNAPVVLPLDGSVQLTLLDPPAGFSIDPANDGAVSVAATAGAGRRVLTYRICETAFASNCATATMTLVVSPDALDDTATTPGGGRPVGGNLAVNDKVMAGATYVLETGATRGTATVSSDGGFLYTPTSGNTGPDSFRYRVCLPAPDTSACDVATVNVVVANNVIVAADDSLGAPVAPGAISIDSVLGNDTLNGELVTAGQVLLSLVTAPTGFVLDADGFLQVPATAVAGVQTLVYRVCERAAPANCADASVQVVVAPQATGEAFQALAGVPFDGSVAGNDNPLSGGVYSLLVGPQQGTLSVLDDGRFTYTAPAGFAGSDAFQYQICLPPPHAAVCATASASLAVQPSLVRAVDDDFSATLLNGAGGLTPSVLLNDELNGQPVAAAAMTFVLTGTPPVGYFLEAGGELRVPVGAQAGSLQLPYELCEAGTRNCASAIIRVVVRPDALDDAFSTTAGRVVDGSVAVNDNAPPGATFALLAPAPTGLQFGADGRFVYTPPALLTGVTAFEYEVCLPGADAAVCSRATVRITVAAGVLVANDDDFRALPLDPGTGGTTNSVLANDTYNGAIPPDPAEMLLSLVGTPAGYIINANGTLTVPGGATAGVVRFDYQMCERALPTNCASATVSLLLTPVAVNDNFSTQAGVVLPGNVASNDNVPAGSVFTVTSATPAGLSFAADGSFTYTPPTGTQGPQTFTYRVCLPGAEASVCAAATVTLNVNAGTLVANDDDFRGTPLDAASGGSTASVLANDRLDGVAPASTAVLLQLVDSLPGITLAADGTLSVAAGSAAGARTVDYQVCEAALPSNCDNARATLLVLPAAAADTFSTPAGLLLAGNVGSNDNAPVGSVYTVSGALPAGLQFNPDGTLLYTPPAGFTGPVTFTYGVCLPAPDSSACSTAVATINVNAGNLVALDDDFSDTPLTTGGTTLRSVLENDLLDGAAPAAASVGLTLVGAPAGFTLDAQGRLQVSAQAPAGLRVLSYQVCELAASGNCASALIRVVVTPQAAPDAFTVPAGQVLDASVAGNDNAPLDAVYALTAAAPPGLLFSASGSFTYTPAPGTVYPLTFTYQVCLAAPHGSECATADATLTLSAGSVVALDDDFSGTPLSPASGGRTLSVLGNDSLNGISPPAAASVLLSLVAAEAGFSIDADGTLGVAAGVGAGARQIGYQLCEAALASNCVTATATVLVAPLAVADALSTPAGVTLDGDVGSNDSVAAGSTFSLTTPSPSGLTFNTDGSFRFVPTPGQTGAVGFSYQVCLPAPYTTTCSTASVVVNVNNGDLTAVADDFTAVALQPGTASPSVLDNDTLNAVQPAPAAAVTLSLVGAPAGYSIDAAGTISASSTAPSGRVALTYQVCEIAASGNCATATALLLVAPTPVADLFSVRAGRTLSDAVGSNDNVPLGSSFTLVAPLPGLALADTGAFTYTPPAGTVGPVTFRYRVCLPAPDAGTCAEADATVNLNTGSLIANDDDFSATVLAAGGSTASVFGNDVLDAITPPDASLLDVSLVNAAAGYTLDSSGVITVSAAAGSGRTTLTYQLCERAAPANCDSARVVVVVAPLPQPDALSVAAGGTVTGNVGVNDRLPAGARFALLAAAPDGLQFSDDGSFSYAPPIGVAGPVLFDYQACLPAPDASECAVASVTLSITSGTLLAANDDFGSAPRAPGTDTPSVLLNDRLNGNVPTAATVQLSLLSAPAGFTIYADGTLGTPANASGATTLSYQICERAAPGNCATATVRVVLSPQPLDDVVSTRVRQTVTGDVGSNDGVPAGATFTVVGTAPAGLQWNGDGSFSYVPPAGVDGAQVIPYQVCLPAPDAGVCASAQLTLNVNLGTLVATADDLRSTPIVPGGTVSTSVLGNDLLNGAAPTAGSVNVALVGAPAGYSVDADGLISVPAATPSGEVAFSYQLCETAAPANCASAGVTLLVAPAPLDDVVSTRAGVAVTGDVGSNDSVPPGATFSVSGTPLAGFQLRADGSFEYAPPVGTLGVQSVLYQVCLPAPYSATCAAATLRINVNAGNLAANDDDFRGQPLAPGDRSASVLDNDRLGTATPPAANSVIVTLLAPPAGLSMDSGGSVAVAAGAASGALSLTYQLCETAAPSNCDTASIALLLAPLAVADSIAVRAGQTASGLLGSNDNAPAGAQYSVVGQVPAGLQLDADGRYRYTPPAGTVGAVSFTYQVCLPAPDAGVCSSASVAVTVSASALLAVADDYSASPLLPGATTPSVLVNDTLDGAAIDPADVVLRWVSAAAGYVLNADGTVTTPVAPAAAVTLTYEVCERASAVTCATADVVVVTRPLPVADVVSAAAGETVIGNVGSNDGVVAGAVFSVQGAVPAGLQFAADGSYTWSAPAGGVGAFGFVYQVCLPPPHAAVCGSANVTLNVNSGTLLARDDDFSGTPLAAGATSSASVLGNDVLDGVTPPASSAVVLSLVGAAQGFVINADGTLVSPAGGTSGVVTLDYQVCERAAPGNCANARVTVVRVPAPVADVVSTPIGQPVSGTVGSNDGVPPGAVFSVVGVPPAGLQLETDGRFTYQPPAGSSGQVSFSYQVCLPAPYTTVCGSTTVTVNLTAGNLIAADDDFRGSPLLPGGSTASVLVNDSLDGVTPPAASSVVLTLPGAPAGVTLGADGRITVAPGATSGAITLTYQVCEAALPSNCDSAEVILLLAPSPQPDVVTVGVGSSVSGTVRSNDNVPPGARFDLVGPVLPGLQFTADGSYLYTPPAGSNGPLSVSYTVCLPAPDAAVCATSTLTFIVSVNVVLAVNDDFTATPVDPSTGGTLPRSVLDNDTFNGVSPPPVGSVAAVLLNAPPGFTLDTQGQVRVAPGTAAGEYVLTYQLCENGAPLNCSTALATVRVAVPLAALVAVDDRAGPLRAGVAAPDLLDVLANDTVDGAPVDPAQVTFTAVATAELQFSASGMLSVPAGVGVGTYSTPYTLCLTRQPTVCATATVTVTVEPGLDSVALQDDWVDVPPNGTLDIDVLANDRMNGVPIDPDTVSISITAPPPHGIAEVMPQARIRFAARTWFAGTQTFDYAVCDLADPTLCASATVTVAVETNVVTVADARMVSEDGAPVIWDAMANASTRTAPLDPASLQVVAPPANGVAACSEGLCTYTPTPAFAGTDSFRYELCDVSVPTRVCAQGTIAVTVGGEQAVLRLSKVAAKRSAQVGDLVRYTVTIDNVGTVDANGATLLDTLPPGFTFVRDGFAVQDADNSARTSGIQPLRIDGIDVAAGERATVVYYLRVGAGTGTGAHTNRITAIDGQDRSIGNVASAEVEITSDPLLDESLVVGSVFDDRNGNGVQDEGERGIPGVRVAAVEGLLMETDEFGRYHLLGIHGGAARGRNFILKVDAATLPAGARFTTPNPLVRRITPGLPARFDFGVTLPEGALRGSTGPATGLVLELGSGLFVDGGPALAPASAAVIDRMVDALDHARGGACCCRRKRGRASARCSVRRRLPCGCVRALRRPWRPPPASTW